MDILQANKWERNIKVSLVSAAYKSKTFKCSLTEVAERLLHFVDIDVCLHLNEILHKGIAEGILTGGERVKEMVYNIKIQLLKLVEDHCKVYLQTFWIQQTGYNIQIQRIKFCLHTCSIGNVLPSILEDSTM